MTAEEAGDPFEALADPNRRAILRLLKEEEMSVQEIADRLPISRPAVSRHLRLLKQAGFVAGRPEGARNLYRLDDRAVVLLRDYLESMWGEVAARFRLVAENLPSERSEDRI